MKFQFTPESKACLRTGLKGCPFPRKDFGMWIYPNQETVAPFIKVYNSASLIYVTILIAEIDLFFKEIKPFKNLLLEYMAQGSQTGLNSILFPLGFNHGSFELFERDLKS